jgi:hypothetical protein
LFPDLVQLFDSIDVPVSELGSGKFCVRFVPGFPACSIGKDVTGGPVLLVQADDALPGTAAPLLLESLCVIHLVRCRVQIPDRDEAEQTLTVIRCTSHERAVHEYFLRCLYPIITTLPPRPSRDDISNAIIRLTELFRKMSEPPQKTIMGLWAELFVIAHSFEPTRLINAWHALPDEKFDFAEGNARLEVKATSGSLRIHHFSLEQLRPNGQLNVLMVSMFVERTVAGTSVADLVDTIRNRSLGDEHLLRLDGVVAQTIGNEWRNLQLVRFDSDLASSSIRFIPAEIIPAVATPVPISVTSVHFRVDLTGLQFDLEDHSIAADSLLLSALPTSVKA